MNHKHNDNPEEEFLHDDALIISLNNGRGISMEPSYFDKTKDIKITDELMEYVLSAQNQGVTLDQENRKVLIVEDLRNDNGRVILSAGAHQNRVMSMDTPPDIIFWLMKDPVLPPVLKVTSDELSAAFGGTLSNIKIKITDSDLLKETEPLTIQPYANPFRTYPARKDYHRILKLISEQGIESYILNTGFFMGLEIPKEVSISIVDNIIAGRGEFLPWNGLENLEIMEIMGYKADFSNINYKNYFMARIQERVEFLKKSSFPEEAIAAMEKLLNEIV
jgi:phosphoenolpyruvate carboxykinase (ATP)